MTAGSSTKITSCSWDNISVVCQSLLKVRSFLDRVRQGMSNLKNNTNHELSLRDNDWQDWFIPSLRLESWSMILTSRWVWGDRRSVTFSRMCLEFSLRKKLNYQTWFWVDKKWLDTKDSWRLWYRSISANMTSKDPTLIRSQKTISLRLLETLVTSFLSNLHL